MKTRDPFHEGQAAAKARRLRSATIGLGLVALVVLIFVISLVRLGAAANGHG